MTGLMFMSMSWKSRSIGVNICVAGFRRHMVHPNRYIIEQWNLASREYQESHHFTSP
jgi:hypothetical protein